MILYLYNRDNCKIWCDTFERLVVLHWCGLSYVVKINKKQELGTTCFAFIGSSQSRLLTRSIVNPFDKVKFGWLGPLVLTKIAYLVHQNIAADPKRNYPSLFYVLRPTRKKTRMSFILLRYLRHKLTTAPALPSTIDTSFATAGSDLHNGIGTLSSLFFFFNFIVEEPFSLCSYNDGNHWCVVWCILMRK